MTASVVVVVPAHDEETTIAATVRSVRASLDHAQEHGMCDRSALEVVAHRCSDRTVRAARTALAGHANGRVSIDERSVTVGHVRDQGVRRGLARLRSAPDNTWVLSTDADTRVGTSWVADVLSTGRRDRAVAVLGLTDLEHWDGTELDTAAYARVLAAKMRPTGSPLHQHDHVYGANLGVRADAYLDVGGFPGVSIGEDQALVDALAARGHRLSRTTSIRVVTSPRLAGRAPGGLADLLSRLSSRHTPVASAAVDRVVGDIA